MTILISMERSVSDISQRVTFLEARRLPYQLFAKSYVNSSVRRHSLIMIITFGMRCSERQPRSENEFHIDSE